MLFGTSKKLVGNVDLWYAVLLIIITTGKQRSLARFRKYLPQMQAHMVHRMKTHLAYISLQGAPEYPTQRVHLDVAVWFVLSSNAVGLDLVRTHLAHIDSLLMLNDIMVTATNTANKSYQLPSSSQAYIDKTKVLMSTISWVEVDRYTPPNYIRALYQKALWLNSSSLNLSDTGARAATDTTAVCEQYVFLDGPATPEQVTEVRAKLRPQYNLVDDATLVKLCDIVIKSDNSTKNIQIPTEPITLPSPVTKWPGNNQSAVIPICPATCRPYSIDLATGLPWTERAKAVYGVDDHKQMFSGNALFGRYTAEYNKYSTPQEFLGTYTILVYTICLLVYTINMCISLISLSILCMYTAYVGKKYDTLPTSILALTRDAVFASFAEVMSSIPPRVFSQRFRAGISVANRQRIEREYLQKQQVKQ